MWTIAPGAVDALTKAVRVGFEASARGASRSRPEPLPRTSIATPTSVFEPGPRPLFPRLHAADPALVDLDLCLQGLALGGDHRPAQLLQHQPGGLIADAELALELLRRDPGVVGGNQVGGPEPEAKRRAGAVHHGARGDRGLQVAVSALPQVATLEHPRSPRSAARASEPFRPYSRFRAAESRARPTERGVWGLCNGDFHSEQPTARASRCDSIRLGGRSYVFYRDGVSCRFGKSWVYRLHGTRGRRRPRGFRCTSGSRFRQGAYCVNPRTDAVFGWHPYD